MRTAGKTASWKGLKRLSCKICGERTSQTTINQATINQATINQATINQATINQAALHQTIINLEDNLQKDKI
jgi:hypothetical protein